MRFKKILLVGLFLVGMTVATVSSVTGANAASCHRYETIANTRLEENGDVWYYTPKKTIPSWSGCQDINLDRTTISYAYSDSGCALFRVRFYPSSGGSYTQASPKLACTGYNSLVLASGVKNGTTYRIEVSKQSSFDIVD